MNMMQMETNTSTRVVPASIGFTPDKNRTWAESFGLAPLMGHSEGRNNARAIIEECFNVGVRDVVFWAMSQSNIHKRSSTERDHLVRLLKEELWDREDKKDRANFYLCGKWQKIVNDPELEDLVARAHERNSPQHTKSLTVLFGYRGLTDILQAGAVVARKFDAEAVEKEDLIRDHMWIKHLPPKIDMLVRTGVNAKNRHNSDTLLPLHGEQAFIYETELKWPEFTIAQLHDSFADYAVCERKKGA